MGVDRDLIGRLSLSTQVINTDLDSVEFVRRILNSVSDGTAVEILLEDTPFNDFSSLSKTLHAEIDQPFTERQVRLFPRMIPVGFYNRIVPNQLVDLGVSWSSMNYLRTQPAFEFSLQSTAADFAAEKHEAFSSTAHQDLISFMTLRASEIREGGCLVAALGAQKPALEAK